MRAAPAETPEQDAHRAAELENALAKLAGQQKRLVASQAKAESDELAELYGAEIRKNEAQAADAASGAGSHAAVSGVKAGRV